MLAVFSVVFWLLLAYGGLVLLGFVFRRMLQVEHRRSEVHFVETDDGWRLALVRHRARGEPAKGAAGAPLLLVPGLGFDAAIFEAGDGALAPALAEAGHDVWILDPRGRGASSRPRLGGRHRANWSLDDYVEFDLPRAIAGVCERAGAAQVHVVGFGLGALVAIPTIAAASAPRVRSLVALGAAAFFGRQQEHVSTRALGLLRFFRPRLWLRLVSPLLGRLDLPLVHLLQLLDNIDPATYRRALVNAISNPSTRELAQWRFWLDRDEYRAADEGPDYRDKLAELDVPLFFIAGPRDRLAPPSMVRATLDACSRAPEKELLVASRQDGLASNYGHLDLLFGRSAARDIAPRVSAFCAKQDALAAESDSAPSSAEADHAEIALPTDPIETSEAVGRPRHDTPVDNALVPSAPQPRAPETGAGEGADQF